MRVVLIGSGRGSNARAILQQWRASALGRAEPVAILSDQATAPILELGPEYGIEALHLDPGPKKTFMPPEYERAWVRAIETCRPDLVVLAGFMRVLKEDFLTAFPGRLINLHPSLLPAFKGLDAIGQAWHYGVKVTGCTVHFVTGDLDGGPIIEQEAVRVEKQDSLESLERKIHAAEHRLLPAVVAGMSEGVYP